MGNTQQLYGRLDMVMLDRQDKIYGSLGMHDSYLLNTVTGNPLTLTHSREGKMDDEVTDCKIYGWSRQESTTGAQLWEFGDIEFEKVTMNTFSIFLKAGTYTITADIESADTDAETCLIAVGKKNVILSRGKKVSVSFEITEETSTIQMYASNNYVNSDGDIATFKNVMLNVGDKALPYEPYTGGQPSPSPDYPQDIESAENPTVTVRGKNLFSGFVFGGTNPKNENGIITTKEGALYIRSDYIPCEVGKHYVYNIPEGWRASQAVFCNSDKKYIGVASPPHSFTVPENAAYFAFQIAKKDTTPIYQADLEAVSKLVQVEQADACTEYEPHHEPQSLTIQTPNGLPGIPVETGGNYTDANGQQWVADYIDLKRGKYVQRVWQKTFDGSESWETHMSTGYYLANILPEKMSNREMLCNQLRRSDGGIASDVAIVGAFGTDSTIYIDNSTLRDNTQADKGLSNWKAHLAEHPLTVMTYLDEPIERDLTPSEVQAYQELVTYAGTTILENDADCYMEVTYKASGNE